MNLHPYLIPMASVRFEEEIKKSLFITYLHIRQILPVPKRLLMRLSSVMRMRDTTAGRLWLGDLKTPCCGD